MSSIRMFAILLITALCLAAFSSAQNSKGDKEASGAGNQVEVKTDRFSGKTTIKLKPQTLIDTPEHKLTMEMLYEVNPKEAAESRVLLEEMAGASFHSHSTKYVDFGDRELHFIIDGKQLAIGKASERIKSPVLILSNKDERGRVPYSSLSSALSISQVEEIAIGKRVEMRLGKIELTLNQATLDSIREFAREFANYAPTRSKKKGTKP
ncbi:MAG: hypothetical protein MOB07_13980 [Acidobacteria bacterium]|nr:hypothetical protein [Acidobacteriota bacterium]